MCRKLCNACVIDDRVACLRHSRSRLQVRSESRHVLAAQAWPRCYRPQACSGRGTASSSRLLAHAYKLPPAPPPRLAFSPLPGAVSHLLLPPPGRVHGRPARSVSLVVQLPARASVTDTVSSARSNIAPALVLPRAHMFRLWRRTLRHRTLEFALSTLKFAARV